MLQEQLIGLLARLLTHLSIRADLPTDDLLQSPQKSLADRWRSHSIEKVVVVCSVSGIHAP